jgi:pyridoxine 5'-phosphate synthase PdxJ
MKLEISKETLKEMIKGRFNIEGDIIVEADMDTIFVDGHFEEVFDGITVIIPNKDIDINDENGLNINISSSENLKVEY